MADFGNDDLIAGATTGVNASRAPSVSFGADDIKPVQSSTPMQTAYPRSFGVRPEMTAKQRQWYNLPFLTRLGAVAENVVSGVPGLGNIGSNNEALNLFREAKPGAAGFGSSVGHAVPYGLAAAVYPPSLYRLPAAMATGGGIEGAGAYFENRNPVEAGVRGALAAIPGHAVSKLVSPMNPLAAEARSVARESLRSDKSLADMLKGAGLHNANDPLGRLIELSRQQAREAINATTPSLGATRLPPWVENAAIGAIGGHYFFDHPVAGGIAGAVIPPLAATAIRSGRQLMHGAIREVEGVPVHPWLARYAENRLLNTPYARAMLQALVMPPQSDYIPTLAGR
jgi:hypothetical protein